MARNRRNQTKAVTFYLFTGYRIPNQSVSQIPYTDLDTVRNQVIYTKDPTGKRSGDYAPIATDYTGKLHMLKSDATRRPSAWRAVRRYRFKDQLDQTKLGLKRNFFMPPKDVVMYSWAAHGKDWDADIGEFLKGSSGVEIVSEQIPFAAMRKPLEPPKPGEPDLDADYRKWYDKQPKKKIYNAFVLSKTRALLLTFSNIKFDGAKVEVWPPNLDPEKDNPFTETVRVSRGLTCAVFFGTPDEFPVAKFERKDGKLANLYTIRVSKISFDHPKSSQSLSNTNHFVFREQVGFPIRNLAGEIDVINCDPISLEEAVMTQFSAQYANIVERANKQQDVFSHQKKTQSETSPEGNRFEAIPKALFSWAEGLGWTYSKAKLATAVIDPGNPQYKKAKSIGFALYDAFTQNADLDQNPYMATVEKTIDLVYSIDGLKGDWNTYIANRVFEKLQEAKGPVTQASWNSIKDLFKGEKWIDSVKAPKGIELLNVTGLSNKQLEELKNLVVPTRKVGLAEFISKVKKVSGYMDAGIGVYAAVKDWAGFWDIGNKKEELERRFGEVNEDYKTNFGDAPSREFAKSIEKYRTATIAAMLEYDTKLWQAINKSIDAALGCSMLIPSVNAAVALVIGIKAGLELVYDLYALIDEALYDSFEKVRCELLTMSHQNMKLAGKAITDEDIEDPKKGEKNVVAQYCIRAEVLYSLIRLLIRAALSDDTKDDDGKLDLDKYLKKLTDDYQLEEFIDRYVLSDGWEYPVRPTVPVRLDSFWLASFGRQGFFKNVTEMNEMFGCRKTTATIASVLSSQMLMYTWYTYAAKYWNDKNIISNFQKYFPIHVMQSKTVKDFAKDFEMTYRNVNNDDIVLVRAYWRPADYETMGSSDRSQPKMTYDYYTEDQICTDGSKLNRTAENDYWEPLTKDTVLTPFDHVRILVVFKESVEKRAYPVSIQLHRTDTLPDIDGPIFKEFAESQNSNLIPADLELVDEQDKKINEKRVCSVFHPFYHFGGSLIAGLKPFGWKHKPNLIGKYSKKRMAYEIKVKVSSESSFLLKPLGEDGIEEVTLEINLERQPDVEKLISSQFFGKTTKEAHYLSVFHPPYNRRLAEKNKLLNDLRKPGAPHGPIYDVPDLGGTYENTKDLDRAISESPFPVTVHKWLNKYRCGFGPLFLRLQKAQSKKSEFVKPIFKSGQAPGFDLRGFDWNDQFELFVTVWTTHIEKKAYAQGTLNWKSLPISLRLISDRWLDDEGPEYNARLRYLGVYDIEKNKLQSDPDFVKGRPIHEACRDYLAGSAWFGSLLDWRLQAIARKSGIEIQSNTGFMEKRHAVVEEVATSLLQRDYHVYIARFVLYYHRPGDYKKILGLRPFGTMLDHDQQYTLKISDLKSGAGTNLFQGGCLQGPENLQEGKDAKDFEILVKSPPNYLKGVPWAEVDSENERVRGDWYSKKAGIIEEWIEDLGTLKDPI